MRLVRQCYVEVSYGGGEMPLLDNEGQSPLLLLTYLFFIVILPTVVFATYYWLTKIKPLTKLKRRHDDLDIYTFMNKYCAVLNRLSQIRDLNDDDLLSIFRTLFVLHYKEYVHIVIWEKLGTKIVLSAHYTLDNYFDMVNLHYIKPPLKPTFYTWTYYRVTDTVMEQE